MIMVDNSNIIAALYKEGSRIIKQYQSSFLLESEKIELKKSCERWKENVLGFIDSYPESQSRRDTHRRFENFFKTLENCEKSIDCCEWVDVITKDLLKLDEMIKMPEIVSQGKTRDVSQQIPVNNKVFIVHGHNDLIKEKVARTLTALGLEPLILHEQPNYGKTIIEKFESNSNDVGFAVVLLTADDIGKAVSSSDDCRKRARQNVILEMGYFMAMLKRSHVFLLMDDDIEKPSDIYGVVYQPIDKEGAWATRLVKELKRCGYHVSADDLP